MRVYIKHGDRYYLATVTRQWFTRHDNSRMVSCGLTVDERSAYSNRVYLSTSGLERLRKQQRLQEVTELDWRHSGCQSSCIRRGDAKCSW